MNPRDDPARTATLVTVGFAVLCLLAVAIGASTSAATYDPFNSDWDGTSALRTGLAEGDARTEVADDPDDYDRLADADGTVVLVVGPAEAVDNRSTEALRRYVRRGGTLIVADDFSEAGNRLLSAVGAKARFDGALLRDERRFWGAPVRPIAGNETTGQLTLNRGTVVRPEGAAAVVSTSPYAYLDENGSGDLDVEEPMGPFAVVTREAVGDGRVIAVSDPSAFVNGMREAPGNRPFLREVLGGHRVVVFDMTGASDPPPLAVGYRLLRRSPPFQLFVGIVGLGVVALLFQGPRPGDRKTNQGGPRMGGER